MKVFFTAAIAGMPQFGNVYGVIVDKLNGLGHKVVSDHIIKANRDTIRDEHSDETRVKWYKKVLRYITTSDVVVAEVSSPSVNVGHEVSLAIEKDTPVIALHKKGHHPVLLQGLRNDKFLLVEYDDVDDITSNLQSYLDYSQEKRDTRFNFFISPKIASYLDWIAKEKRIPRAVYLRNLIKDRMLEDREYQED